MADKDASSSDAGGKDAGSEMELTGQSKTILDVMKGLFAEFAQTTDAKIERLSQEVARTKRDHYESDSESQSDVSSTECKKRKTDSDPDVLVAQEDINHLNLDETELAFLKRKTAEAEPRVDCCNSAPQAISSSPSVTDFPTTILSPLLKMRSSGVHNRERDIVSFPCGEGCVFPPARGGTVPWCVNEAFV
ncbi:hypothetical protein BaRGS_00034245 [Batillaria attramentaria]|uniref:Uncharacterized protein n=1 Tax=Batillaria attramentaria TaxID=370345 RepID=A0ABD0JHQ9_9CAEN